MAAGLSNSLQERKLSPLEKGGTLSGAAAAGKVRKIGHILQQQQGSSRTAQSAVLQQ